MYFTKLLCGVRGSDNVSSTVISFISGFITVIKLRIAAVRRAALWLVSSWCAQYPFICPSIHFLLSITYSRGNGAYPSSHEVRGRNKLWISLYSDHDCLTLRQLCWPQHHHAAYYCVLILCLMPGLYYFYILYIVFPIIIVTHDDSPLPVSTATQQQPSRLTTTWSRLI